ncbi:MAG: 4Fe-4S binding protein [Candidatus Helarchaeota archaeon]
MDKNRKKKLKKLVNICNKHAKFSLPTFIGSLVQAFDTVLNDEEVDFLLKIGTASLTLENLKSQVNLSEADFSRIFNSLINKGILWSNSLETGEIVFEIPPMMLGWFELSFADNKITTEKKEFSKHLTNYFNTFKKFNLPILRSFINLWIKYRPPMSEIATLSIQEPKKSEKIIKINNKIELTESKVFTLKTTNSLIKKYGREGKIAITNCLCRQHWDIEGEPCRLKLPLEAHLWIGKVAEHVIKYKLGREITTEEALSIIEECHKKGGINHVWHNRMDLNEPEISICNCCWDCCASIGNWNRGIMPILLKCYYIAIIPDIDICTGCGKCTEYCPTQSIKLINKKAVNNQKLCIGCGQCEFQCPNNAVKLINKERLVLLPSRNTSKWNKRIKSL